MKRSYLLAEIRIPPAPKVLGRVYLDGRVNRKISALAGGPLSGKKPEFFKVVESRVQTTL